MDGNKFRCLEERWRLIRNLYETHAVSLDALATITGCELSELASRSLDEAWSMEEGGGTDALSINEAHAKRGELSTKSAGDGDIVQLTREAKLKTALNLAVFLGDVFARERSKGEENFQYKNSEAQIKEMLSIAKALQFLEGLTLSLENAPDEADLYPQDVMEFHQQLEKQIANLAASATAGTDHDA